MRIGLGLGVGRARGRIAGGFSVVWRSGFAGGSIPPETAPGTVLADLVPGSSMGTVTFSEMADPSALFSVTGTTLVLSASISPSTSASVTIRGTGTLKTVDLVVTATSTPAQAAPSNTVPPTISGGAVQGYTLSASTGTWTGYPSPTFAYQWKAAGVNISGATASTYLLTGSEVGKVITVTVTATNASGSASATSAATATVTSSPVAPSIASVTISDTTPSVGDVLSVAVSVSGNPAPTLSYVWKSDGATVGTSATYTVQAGDVGKAITCTVLATNTAGSDVDISAATSPVSGAPAVPVAPVLTLLDSSSIAIDLTGEQAGDVVRLYRDGVLASEHTLTQDEIDNYTVDLGMSGWAGGTYDVTATYQRGGNVSAVSNTVTVTIIPDTTAPTLSAASGTQTGQTTADLSVSTNELTGTLYVVVTTSSTAPSAAQVKAGQNNSGSAAVYSSSQAVSSTGTKTFSVLGLTLSTTYYAYFMHEDAAGNQSAVAASASFTTAGAGEETETAALVARMSVAPDSTRRGHVNTLIAALKTAGIWTKLDCFYVMAAHDAQAARLNWKGSSFDLTAVSSPTFTTDRGYQGNGTSSYLDTGFNAATATSPKFTQDSGTFGIVSRTDAISSVQWDIGFGNAAFNCRSDNGNGLRGKINASANVTYVAASSIGHFTMSRTTSALTRGYKDGAQIGSDSTAASVALSNGTIKLLSDSGLGNFSMRQLSAGYIGAGLTGTEVSSLHSAISSYLTAVGA